MDDTSLSAKIRRAAKWSSISEVTAKIITPLSSMALARILNPEAFGVVVTITMVISFADIFADAGFQKYLVQHEFADDEDKRQSATVAFWTNLAIAFLLWALIALFRDPIANAVGSPGMGFVIVIACIQVPITSIASMQAALYKRDFDFKTLFLTRIVSIIVPFVVTIPLALMGYNYWSLIIGNICGQLANAIILTARSKWKPRFFYSLEKLKEMLSFSAWSLVEALSIWLTAWIDSFIISSALSEYYLGLYKTSINMVNSFMAVITASVIPVLFSALSRLQENKSAFENMFFKVQRIVAYLIMPMGVGLFLYRDLATQIMLGDKWAEAANIIGIQALTSAIVIVTSYFNSEAYRAVGKPRLSLISQMIHLAFLVPTCLISLHYGGFWPLVYARALIRLQAVIMGFWIMHRIMGMKFQSMMKNLFTPALSTVIMAAIAVLLQQVSASVAWELASILICMICYYCLLRIFAKQDLQNIKTLIFKRK